MNEFCMNHYFLSLIIHYKVFFSSLFLLLRLGGNTQNNTTIKMKQIFGEVFLFLIIAILNCGILCDIVYDDDSINAVDDRSIRHHFNKNNVENKTRFRKKHWTYNNFIMTDYLSDGEMERRLSLNGVTAKETSLGNDR